MVVSAGLQQFPVRSHSRLGITPVVKPEQSNISPWYVGYTTGLFSDKSTEWHEITNMLY
jgi:hypothetical protein